MWCSSSSSPLLGQHGLQTGSAWHRCICEHLWNVKSRWHHVMHIYQQLKILARRWVLPSTKQLQTEILFRFIDLYTCWCKRSNKWQNKCLSFIAQCVGLEMWEVTTLCLLSTFYLIIKLIPTISTRSHFSLSGSHLGLSSVFAIITSDKLSVSLNYSFSSHFDYTQDTKSNIKSNPVTLPYK